MNNNELEHLAGSVSLPPNFVEMSEEEIMYQAKVGEMSEDAWLAFYKEYHTAIEDMVMDGGQEVVLTPAEQAKIDQAAKKAEREMLGFAGIDSRQLPEVTDDQLMLIRAALKSRARNS